MSINVFGQTYTTAAAIYARLGKLALDNIAYGTSDDRVTESILLYEALMNEISKRLGDRLVDTRARDILAANIALTLSQSGLPVLSLEEELDIACKNALVRRAV